MAHSAHYQDPQHPEDRIVIHYNGDYSGEATLVRVQGTEILGEFKIDTAILRSFVAEMVRTEAISKIEGADEDEILRKMLP